MTEETASSGAIEALSRAKAIHEAAVSPENHLLIRNTLVPALAELGSADPAAQAEARALLADALVSDYLHRWNEAGTEEIDRAEREVEQALKLEPNLAFAHYVGGFVKRARGDHRGALDAFERALELDPGFARGYAQKANELINVGQPEKAPALVKKAITMSPTDPSLGMFYWILGRAYFFCGAYREAIPWLEKSIVARPNVWYNRLYLVSAYALQADDALREFKAQFSEHTLELVQSNEKTNPNDHPHVREARARFHDGLRRAGVAERPTEGNIDDALSRARALYRDALTPENTLIIRDILENAIEHLVYADDPRRLAETWAFLADVLTCDYLNHWNDAGHPQLELAESAVHRALDIVHGLPLAHYVTGFIQRARGNHDAALAAFDKTIQLDADFVRAYAQKANELISVGRADEAPQLVEKAIGLLPPGSLALGMFYWIIGRAFFFMNQLDEAIYWLEKSVEVRPNLTYNRLYLASSYALSTHRKTEAETTLRAFDEQFPGYTVARVISEEGSNPNQNPSVVEGRHRYHQGLLAAGMPAE
jgi:tetratricopeptide (TPR) repeat protein